MKDPAHSEPNSGTQAEASQGIGYPLPWAPPAQVLCLGHANLQERWDLRGPWGGRWGALGLGGNSAWPLAWQATVLWGRQESHTTEHTTQPQQG